MAASAIIVTTGKRDSLGRVVNHLREQKFIDEIILIFDREMDGPYKRHEAVKRAKNELIYYQDDDCLVKNIEEIYQTHVPGYVTVGMKAIRWPIYLGERAKMIGWGAFFERDMINVLDQYIEKFGVDPLFKRESDRVFTYMNKTQMIKAEIRDFPCAIDGDALCIKPEHEDFKKMMLERLKETW